MPPSLERPIQKVTLNLFRDDVAEMVAVYGQGWTGQVRLLVENHIKERAMFAKAMKEALNAK